MTRGATTADHALGDGGHRWRLGEPGSPGHVLDLIRRSGGLTRAEILQRTGLARSTVASRLSALLSAGLITAGGSTAAARGRPASQFRFRDDNGVLLLADAGATRVRIAVTALNGRVHHETSLALDITMGPEAWLAEVSRLFSELIHQEGCDPGFVQGIGVALPGPVDFASATVVQPPIMTGWNGYPIRSWFAERYACPVIVDNDANAMAIGEYTSAHTQRNSLIMLKIATGIGAGIVLDGHLYRGEDGAAGDIGHIQIGPPDQQDLPLCRCGNLGCVEAFAGGWALVRELRARDRQVDTVADLVSLVRAGDPMALSMTREAGRTIGVALADAVSLLNPAVVVVGGELGDAAANLVAGLRETVYARSLPLATRGLEIQAATLGPSAGLVGLAITLTSYIFHPSRIDATLGG